MKWLAITVIILLVAGLAAAGYFYLQETNKLKDAQSEIVALEGNVATLEENVSTLETNLADSEATVTTLETDLEVANAEIGDLQADLSTQQTINSSLEGNISTLEGTISTLEGNVSTLETDLAESEATVATLETDLEVANAENENLQADVKTLQTLNLVLSEEVKKVKDPRHFASTQELADWLQKDTTDEEWTLDDHTNYCYILQVRALRDGFLLPVSYEYFDEELYPYNIAVIGTEVYYVSVEDDYTIEVYFLYKALPSHPLPLD